MHPTENRKLAMLDIRKSKIGHVRLPKAVPIGYVRLPKMNRPCSITENCKSAMFDSMTDNCKSAVSDTRKLLIGDIRHLKMEIVSLIGP